MFQKQIDFLRSQLEHIEIARLETKRELNHYIVLESLREFNEKEKGEGTEKEALGDGEGGRHNANH